MKKILYSLILTFLFCAISFAKEITIYTTNDLHGRLEPVDYKNLTDVGGAARRAAVFVKDNKTLILDAGDFAQGTLYYKVFKDDINLEVLKKQNYDAITLGNHEFDHGLESLKYSISTSNVPFLSANIKFKDRQLNKLVKDYIIKDVNGIKAGIIGVTTQSIKATTDSNPEEYEVLDEIKTIKKIVKKIDKSTDIIIVLSHSGINKDIEIAKNTDNIDLIIGGHSHTLLRKPVVIEKKKGNVYITQNGEFGVYAGKIVANVENDKITDFDFQLIPIDASINTNKEIEDYISIYTKQLEIYQNETAGTTTLPINSKKDFIRTNLTTAGSLLNKAELAAFPEAECAISVSGCLRQGGIIPAGEISYKDIFELLPFENYVVISQVKGKDILSVLENSARLYPKPSNSFLQVYNIDYTIDLKKEPMVMNENLTQILKKGSRVKNVFINSEPLDLQRYYSVATDSFLFNGGDGYIQFKNSKNPKHTYYFLDRMLIDYLKNNSPITPEVKNTVRIEE
ncbi:MAG: bifunctional UDP-sugar hydrolase/5'-nucleotidase [Candidatus Gastranaerophilales bacterium]|nr:bifunctional UDP-sugar hydrolase/5'-nucleotidase [Candidatus Gastranaerophilales bacterium]